MAAQLAGGVWWVSQQAATIANLEETVSQLGSKMAIEDNVNLKRDVVDNSKELEYVWDDMDELWEESKQYVYVYYAYRRVTATSSATREDTRVYSQYR
jgi:hypothetical protein